MVESKVEATILFTGGDKTTAVRLIVGLIKSLGVEQEVLKILRGH